MPQNRVSDWKKNASYLRNDLLDLSIRKEISLGKFGRMTVKFIQGSTVIADLSKSALLQIISDHAKKCDQKPFLIYPLAHAYTEIKALDKLFIKEEQKLKRTHVLSFLIAKVRNLWNARYTHKALRRTIDATMKKNMNGAKDEATFYSNAAALTAKELLFSLQRKNRWQSSAEKGVVLSQVQMAHDYLELQNAQGLKYLGLDPSLYGSLNGPHTTLSDFFSSKNIDLDAATIHTLITACDMDKLFPYFCVSASKHHPAGLGAMGHMLLLFHEKLKDLGKSKAAKAAMDQGLEMLKQAGANSPHILKIYYRSAVEKGQLSIEDAIKEVRIKSDEGNIAYLWIYANLLKRNWHVIKERVKIELLERIASFGCIADQKKYSDLLDQDDAAKEQLHQYIDSLAEKGVELFQALRVERLLADPDKKQEALHYLKGLGEIENEHVQVFLAQILLERNCTALVEEYLKRYSEKGNHQAQRLYAKILLNTPDGGIAAKQTAIRYLRLADEGDLDNQLETAKLLLRDPEELCRKEAERYLLLALDKKPWKAELILNHSKR